MSQFTKQKLVDGRVIVSGTDQFDKTGSAVVDSREWDNIQQMQAHREAHATFDEKVEEFFAPILEAAAALDVDTSEQVDELTYLVLYEGEEGVESKPAEKVWLSKDSQILRILESGDHSRLVWVGDDLEILASTVQVEEPPAEVSFTGLTDQATASASSIRADGS